MRRAGSHSLMPHQRVSSACFNASSETGVVMADGAAGEPADEAEAVAGSSGVAGSFPLTTSFVSPDT